MNPRLQHVGYEVRRVAQTPRAFANWPALLGGMAAQKVGRGTAELQFVTRSGVRITCPNVPGARLPLYEQFADDSYRLDEFLAPLAQRPFTVFDIGSHVGSFAVRVASAMPSARVECFEPSPQSSQYLRMNIEQNHLGDRVVAHEVALSDTVGTALLDDNDGGSVHNGLVDADHRLVAGDDAQAQRRTLEVATTTFDAAVGASTPPDVVKLDCEGGEYAMVEASSPASWSNVSRIVMEYHPVAGRSWDELRTWFAGVGLQVVRHDPIAPGLGTAWLARTP